MQRDLRDVVFGEIPDAPVAKFPACFRQPVEIFRRDGINKILVRAPDKNSIGLHGESKLRDDGC